MLKDAIKESWIKNIFGIRMNVLVLNDSAAVNYVMTMYSWVKERIGEYAVKSEAVIMARVAQNSIYSNPLRSLGLIITIAAMTNITLSLLLDRKTTLPVWFMRADLLILGAIWASCKVEIYELKRTSLWAGWIKKCLWVSGKKG